MSASCALTRADWDVTLPPPASLPEVDLVLHAAAWTDVDGAEAHPQDAAAVNVGGTQHAAELGAPLVLFSTDYVFDGRQARAVPRVGRAEPALGLRPHEAAGRGRGRRRRLDRPHVVALRLDEHELRPHDAPARRRARRGGGRRRPARLARPTSATSRPRCASCSNCRRGLWHLTADGDCTWADFAEAIFEDGRASTAASRRITTEELGRPAPRPAYSVLRSERPEAPRLPHWRDGLRACLAALSG